MFTVRGSVIMVDGVWLIVYGKSSWSSLEAFNLRIQQNPHRPLVTTCRSHTQRGRSVGVLTLPPRPPLRTQNRLPLPTLTRMRAVHQHLGRARLLVRPHILCQKG